MVPAILTGERKNRRREMNRPALFRRFSGNPAET